MSRAARVRGPGLVEGGSYQARPAMAKGLYFLSQVDAGQPVTEPQKGVKVRISEDLSRRVGSRKLPGETLDSAVCRLLCSALK